jgi:mitogen-activated protein kinase 1/3
MQGIFSITAKIFARRILREIVLLKRLKHPYIVELVDIIEPLNRDTFDEIYLVLELADLDLKKMIECELNLTMEEVRIITYKLLCCLNYLHSAKIIHRDLKPDNILLTNTINQATKEKNRV